jgi:uncharacterized membrane protein
MYRESDSLPERSQSPEPEIHAHAPHGRHFAPVPVGIFTGLVALFVSFLGMFLLGWGVAPTSIGCGASRSVTMVVAMLAISVVVIGVFSAIGVSLMREARAPQRRVRSYLLTSLSIFTIGTLPLLAFSALLGSCFDF